MGKVHEYFIRRLCCRYESCLGLTAENSRELFAEEIRELTEKFGVSALAAGVMLKIYAEYIKFRHHPEMLRFLTLSSVAEFQAEHEKQIKAAACKLQSKGLIIMGKTDFALLQDIAEADRNAFDYYLGFADPEQEETGISISLNMN